MACLLTGHISQQAAALLKGAHARVFTGAKGTVQSALEAFSSGQLTEQA